jgi:hypothetical protein
MDISENTSEQANPFDILENELLAQRNVTNTMQDTLNHIMQRLNELGAVQQLQQIPQHAPAMPQPAPQPPQPPPQPVAAPQRNRLKPAVPQDFDGDRKKGRAFLNSCTLYMQLCANEFADDQAKIHWALTYMKSGRASAFANRVIRSETRNPGVPRYASWDAFRTTFVTTFCPENEATDAILRLESTSYFQGRRTVDQYIDEFEDLVDLSGYTDNIAIVIKFRRGLSPAIQDRVAESGTDRPGDADPAAWYRIARRYDQNRLANEAFHSSSTRRMASSTTTTASNAPVPRFATPLTSAVPPTASHFPRPPPRPLPPGIPMDIDSSKAKQTPQTCYRCGQAGHVLRDCPRRFNVRHMSNDEREDLLMNLLAEKDAVKEEEPQNDEEDVSQEDFTSSDG